MAISPVVDLSSGQLPSLVDLLLAPASGISVVAGSISLTASGNGAVNTYDAVTGAGLGGIGAGLLLTSGATPGTSNTLTWFGSDNGGSNFYNGDADIDAVVNTVFQTQSYDATVLKFDFKISNPALTSISFDLVFGSEEYPEWVDAFVDCAVVIVDGVNYALFNKNPNAPLSVISPNLAAGYFQDNASGAIPIEYDGVSGRLRIVAPLDLNRQVHTIKIAIADTGDHILDSGLFISGISAGTDPGSGVVSDPGGGTTGDDNCSGSSKDEYFNLLAGDDTVYAAGGADIVVAGSGNDKVYGGSGDDEIKGDGGDDLVDGGGDLDTAVYSGASNAYGTSFNPNTGCYSIDGSSLGEGIDTLVGIEQLKFSDGLFTLSQTGGVVSLTPVTAPPPPSQPVNSAGGVVITDAYGGVLSGPTAIGSTLLSQVSDADGIGGSIAYQWFSDGLALSGATSDSYVIQESDTGHFLSVSVSYSDALGFQENHSSQSLLALPANGDLLLTLMSIEGPSSAAVYTPITTLLLRAIEQGETPNTAIQKIRAALNVPAAVGSLLSTNAYQILKANLQENKPEDPTALALAKLEAEVAILCSISGDQSGSQLAQVLLSCATSGHVFNLANAADLGLIQGLSSAAIDLAVQRNGHIQKAVSLMVGGDSIQTEWQDFISNWDLTLTNLPLSVLSHAINQAPVGQPTAPLPHLLAGQAAFSLSAAQLLTGLQDPDGDTLSVQGLSTDQGEWFVQDPTTGDWSLDVNAAGYDPAYVGPLELSYSVDDGHGHALVVSQILVVDPLNHAPSGVLGLSVLGGGALQQNATLQVTDALSDLDGIASVITYSWYAGSSKFGEGSSIVLGQNQVGQAIHVEATYVDGLNKQEWASSTATAAVANVNDEPSGGVTITAGSPPKTGETITASQNIADLDGIPTSGSGALLLQWQSSADGISWSDIAGATGPSLVIGGSLAGLQLRAQARYTDNYGTKTQVNSTASAAVVGVGINWTGTSAAETRNGTAWDDTLNGGGGSDTLSGLAGNDWLDGGTGSDTLIGGLGDDTFVVDSSSDLITELTGEGRDIAQASVTYSLLSKGANVEGLVLSGTAAINGTGNALDNTLSGNGAANVLDGGAGNDTMTGGAGNDTYVIDSAADVVEEASAGGSDLVQSSISFSLAGLSEVENLTLTGTTAINGTGNALANTLTGNSAANGLSGGAGNDKLTGQAGQDWLDGGTGIDTLVGGLGDDTFVVDDANDLITELSGEGYDTVQASVTYSLLSKGANVEALVLSGTAAINGTGNALANALTGNSAANVLDGGAGNDTMTGGAGNDTYVIDSAADAVVETSGGGSDLVQSSISFSLAGLSEVENLTLTGTAATNGTGNALANALTGNSAANVLDGGAGNDTMTGGAGNDTYVIDSAADAVVEASGGGSDLVQSSISFSLAGLSAVENLTLTGTAAINGTGNALANGLTGNEAANLLQGSSGSDTISGAGGQDTLAGGKGSDQLTGGLGGDGFRFDTALEKVNGTAVVDTITDFTPGQADQLELSSQVFTALSGAAVSGGLLTPGAFLASASGTATTSAQRILYNTTTGQLLYDSDGSGSSAAQAFASLTGLPGLTNSMILVSNLPLGV